MNRYHLDTITGSVLIDSDGRGMSHELAGRVISRHRLLERAISRSREENLDRTGPRVVVVHTATGRIVA